MRETFKEKQQGDSLSKGFVNKLARVARKFSSSVPNSYGYGREGAGGGHTPWAQIIVKVVSTPDENGLQSALRMYFDEDERAWLVDSDANPIDIDPSPFGLTVQADDVIAGWWHEQRGAFVPIIPRAANPTPPPTPDPPPEVVTPCGCTCVQGVDLPGTRTVCCRGPLVFEYQGWPGILFRLKWKGDDQWASDPFEGPECDLGGGTQGNNMYRWLMQASATFGMAELRLEVVTDNGCPLVCIIYRSLKKFICRCSNEFYLYDWKNIERDQIPCGDVCIHPVGESSLTPPGTTSCIMIGSATVDAPGAFEVQVSGFDGFQNVIAGGGPVGANYARYFSPSTTLVPPRGVAIDINRTYIASLGNPYYSAGFTPTRLLGCYPQAFVQPCVIYGGRFGGFPFPQSGYDVGWESVSQPNFLLQKRVINDFHVLLVKIENYTPGNLGLMLLARVGIPGVTGALVLSGSAGPIYARYKSEVFEVDADQATQADLDAIFDLQIKLTYCSLHDGVDTELDPTAYPGITIPGVIYARSLSSAVLANQQPTDSGACDSTCEPPDADIGEDDDSDPGGCCIGGIFFKELTQAECTEAGGGWFADVEAGETACEGKQACCDGSDCFEATRDECIRLGGVAQAAGVTCSNHPCADDTSSQSASSLSPSSASSQSASSQSQSSASSSISSASPPGVVAACCYGFFTPTLCVETTEADCMTQVGAPVWLYPGTLSCSPNPCPP